ncbi:MAG: hypothetical protein U0236_22420 [Nitrospira sp.]
MTRKTRRAHPILHLLCLIPLFLSGCSDGTPLNEHSFDVHQLQINLDEVETKLSSLNQLDPPLFQLKFDGQDHVPGVSDLTIDVGANSLLGIPKAIHSTIALYEKTDDNMNGKLDELEFAGHKIYFQDLNSSKVTATLDRRDPLALVLEIPFEIDGPAEIKVEGGDDLDLRLFTIKLRLEITRQKQSLDLFSFVWEIENALAEGTSNYFSDNDFGTSYFAFTVRFRGEKVTEIGDSLESAKAAVRVTLAERFITTTVSVNAWWSEIPWSWLNDGEDRVRRAFNSKIYDKLKQELNSGTTSAEGITTLLNTMVKKVLGIDESFLVRNLSSDGRTLDIEYFDVQKR